MSDDIRIIRVNLLGEDKKLTPGQKLIKRMLDRKKGEEPQKDINTKAEDEPSQEEDEGLPTCQYCGYPMEEDLKGKVYLRNISASGLQSDVEAEKYTKVKASGSIDLENVEYKDPEYPLIKIMESNMVFTPSKLTVNTFKAFLGSKGAGSRSAGTGTAAPGRRPAKGGAGAGKGTADSPTVLRREDYIAPGGAVPKKVPVLKGKPEKLPPAKEKLPESTEAGAAAGGKSDRCLYECDSRIIGSITFVLRSIARTIVLCSTPSRLLATTGSNWRRSGMLNRTVKVPSGRSFTGSPAKVTCDPALVWP